MSRFWIAVLAILGCLCISSVSAALPKQNGLVFGAEEWSPLYSYKSPEAQSQLVKLAQTGANWVRILVTWFQDNVNTTQIYPIEKPSLFASATDDELEFIIKRAHELGLNVMLSPIVDPNWEFSTNHRSGPGMTWRGLIGLYFNETDWEIWFDSYGDFVLRYAAMAARLGVEQFCVGAELNSPFTRERQFRSLITEIKGMYDGSLTVATLYNQVSNTSNWPLIKWYDAIDVIGVDGYFELYTSSSNPTVDEIVQAWKPYYGQLLWLHQKWNKRIMFVECGYTSAFETHKHPAHMDLIAYDDCSVWALCVFLQEQANCYEAVFETFYQEDWFAGIFWWLWRTDPWDGHTSDPGFSPVGKPAEQVLSKWYHEWS